MAKPWRDIINQDDFKALVNQKLNGTTAQGQARIGFTKHTNVDLLRELHTLISEYHSLDKRRVALLSRRRSRLQQISKKAQLWFSKFKANETQAKDRGQAGMFAQSRLEYSLDRTLLTLVRQSLRKADYLKKLQRYCETSDPRDLIDRVEAPQATDGGVLGLAVKMEAEDFMHRDGYEDGPLRHAFEDWATDTKGLGLPFFLWLESHAICLSGDRTSDEVSDTRVVEYVGSNRPSASSKMRLLDLSSPPIRVLDLTGSNAGLQTCDTDSDYSGGSGKAINPSNKFGRGVACFVWSPNNEVFIAEHQPGKFHHSSFLAGGNVKCAGMIRIQSGVVTELSNNSGHYKPPIDNMRTFIEWLGQRMVLSNQTYLKLGAGAGLGGFDGTYQDFQSRGGRLGRGGINVTRRLGARA